MKFSAELETVLSKEELEQLKTVGREKSLLDKYLISGQLPGRDVRSARSKSDRSMHIDSAKDTKQAQVTTFGAEMQVNAEQLKANAKPIALTPKGPSKRPAPEASTALTKPIPIHLSISKEEQDITSKRKEVPSSEKLQGKSEEVLHEIPKEDSEKPPIESGSLQEAPEEDLESFLQQNRRRILSALRKGKVSGDVDAESLRLLQRHLLIEADAIHVDLGDEHASAASVPADSREWVWPVEVEEINPPNVPIVTEEGQSGTFFVYLYS